MKKPSFLFLSFYLAFTNLSAQDIVFTFNAKDASNTIDSIKATKVETGETAFVDGSNTINLSSFTTGTKLFPSNPQEIRVYPNPFENYTQLIFHSNQNDNIKVSLINAAGQIVAEKNQDITSGMHQFNILTNNNGLYILNITGNQTKFSQKIISTNNNQTPNKIEYGGYSSISSKEKSAKTEGGEIIHFFVYSGDNITKIADSSAVSKSYEVEFYECKDADGKSYPIVQIGDQWWMAENLKYLPSVSTSSTISNSSKQYYVYSYDGTSVSEAKTTDNYNKYGVLYNWSSAITACPDGWKLPEDDEWKQLELNIGMTQNEANGEDWRGTDEGTKLKSTIGWRDNFNGTDDYGFTSLPGGYLFGNSFALLGDDLAWWCLTEFSSTEAWYRFMTFNATGINRYYGNKEYGFSVRCVKDENLATTVVNPEVETNEATFITTTAATLNGNVISDGGAIIIQRGFYWSNSNSNPDENDNVKFVSGTTGNMTFELTGLQTEETIYYKAWAKNNEELFGFGNPNVFTTRVDDGGQAGELGNFTDSRDEHEYLWVRIGKQVWMAENLAFNVVDGCWAYDNDESNVENYGRLYTWEAANSACPEGWHLSTDEEWQVLAHYIIDQEGGFRDDTDKWYPVGKFLKSEDAGGNNKYNFSALLGGTFFNQGNFALIGSSGIWWLSETGVNSEYGHVWTVGETDDAHRSYYEKTRGLSVRCVKD